MLEKVLEHKINAGEEIAKDSRFLMLQHLLREDMIAHLTAHILNTGTTSQKVALVMWKSGMKIDQRVNHSTYKFFWQQLNGQKQTRNGKKMVLGGLIPKLQKFLSTDEKSIYIRYLMEKNWKDIESVEEVLRSRYGVQD